METPATYTASPSPISADDLLGQIRGIIEQRDAYKAKCERQDKIIEKLSDLIGELQVYSVDLTLDGLDALANVGKEPEPSPAKVSPPEAKPVAFGARRYTEAEVQQWAAALRAGKSQLQVSAEYQVSTRTIHKRVIALGYDPVTGFPRNENEIVPEPEAEDTSDSEPTQRDAEPEASKPAPEPEPTYSAPPVNDDTVAEWVRLVDVEHRTAEWIADRWGIDPYYVRGRVRQYREERGETVEVFEEIA